MADGSEQLQLIKYLLLQITIGPALLCDCFVFIYFIRHWRKEILKSPQNHAIFCLLMLSFIEKITDATFLLYYLRWSVVLQQTNIFCAMWNWCACSILSMTLYVLACCCIERHLFVFNTQLMKKQWCLILFHYIPLTICLLYPPLFYFVNIFFPTTCISSWDYTLILCGGPCYSFSDPLLGSLDWLIHSATPTFIVILLNFLLFCRVIWQKIKRQQPVQWNRQRRMIIQLVFISTAVLICVFPAVIVGVIQSLGSPDFLFDIQFNYFYYIIYLIDELLPFTIVSSLPKMHKEWRHWIHRVKRYFHSRIRIDPGLSMTTQHGNGSTV
ncbi:unnamed protein product [Adineta steineri]|uniref:G-protein coupled receptors family 1 profile domain-containing protein n=1 Tax=Adineta steineri TaxID=433720 RepID=A0A815NZ83_9BILA|nr:unnamed protein product [Adineta steineri]CAF4010083.1 unnamed protein product [Adineta steineri]